MRKANIIAAAIRGEMDRGIIWQFVEFFSQAFPNESDNIKSYVDTWVDRFNKGNPRTFMDSERQECWDRIIDQLDYPVNEND